MAPPFAFTGVVFVYFGFICAITILKPQVQFGGSLGSNVVRAAERQSAAFEL